MPNVYSCDLGFVLTMLKNCPEMAVVVGWSKTGGEENNKWIEELSKLEQKGIPVLVADLDSCGNLAKDLGIKAGETQLYRSGERVETRTTLVNDLASVEYVIRSVKNAKNTGQ
jgi:hypothetical protein